MNISILEDRDHFQSVISQFSFLFQSRETIKILDKAFGKIVVQVPRKNDAFGLFSEAANAFMEVFPLAKVPKSQKLCVCFVASNLHHQHCHLFEL